MPPPLTLILHYGHFLYHDVPETAVESFAGVGNPFSVDTIYEGETVLGLGSPL